MVQHPSKGILKRDPNFDNYHTFKDASFLGRLEPVAFQRTLSLKPWLLRDLDCRLGPTPIPKQRLEADIPGTSRLRV